MLTEVVFLAFQTKGFMTICYFDILSFRVPREGVLESGLVLMGPAIDLRISYGFVRVMIFVKNEIH